MASNCPTCPTVVPPWVSINAAEMLGLSHLSHLSHWFFHLIYACVREVALKVVGQVGQVGQTAEICGFTAVPLSGARWDSRDGHRYGRASENLTAMVARGAAK